MTNVKWNPNLGLTPQLYFNDLKCGECFRIDTMAAKGAVYMKVDWNGTTYMLEVATAKILTPTSSPVARVQAEITIGAQKPNIYS